MVCGGKATEDGQGNGIGKDIKNPGSETGPGRGVLKSRTKRMRERRIWA